MGKPSKVHVVVGANGDVARAIVQTAWRGIHLWQA